MRERNEFDELLFEKSDEEILKAWKEKRYSELKDPERIRLCEILMKT